MSAIDNEAKELWQECTDVDPERILKFGNKDNFWEMGETGPCGPCSEIHYYVGKNLKNQNKDGVNRQDDYRELWNLVFIEFNRKSDGSLEKLPLKHVDTGMGFERLCMVLQGVKSNYDTDVFKPLISKLERVSNKSYGKDKKTDIATLRNSIKFCLPF